MMKMMNDKQKAFTLIELLVVVAIIALIGLFVLFVVKDIRAKSRDVRRVSDIKSIQDGLAMYHNDHQLYPVYDGYITGSDAMSNALIGDEIISGALIDPLNETIEGVVCKYYYQSSQGRTYLIEYYLETDSVQSKSQGLNTVIP